MDKLIQIAVELIVPGRGAGESNWMMKNWRAFEQGTEKSQREMEIRNNLRKWDQQVPEFHHELMVRYLSGVVASSIVSGIYSMFRPSRHVRRR